MPQNTSPIFPLTPRVSWGTLSAANTATDGTGTVVTVFTAQVSGSRVDYLNCACSGSANASIMRVFINNGLTNTTATNNTLFTEVSMPSAVASSLNPSAATFSVPLNLSLPSGSRINVTLGTAVAGGWHITAVGGDY